MTVVVLREETPLAKVCGLATSIADWMTRPSHFGLGLSQQQLRIGGYAYAPLSLAILQWPRYHVAGTGSSIHSEEHLH